jgi:hypothetical protein
LSTLLVFSRDPGPTNELIATLDALSDIKSCRGNPGLEALAAVRGFALPPRIVTRPPGDGLWRDAGYSVELWDGKDEEAASALLSGSGVLSVLTGTSDLDEPGDRALWAAARSLGIESHAVLDHPAGLAERFRNPNGRMSWPDWLYVSDEVFARRLSDIGAPAERIRMIGDLHHLRLRRIAGKRSPEEIGALRGKWGAGESDFVLLFVSECTAEMTLFGYKSTYVETEVLDSMLRTLKEGSAPWGGAIDPSSLLVIVRAHPRDKKDKYRDVIDRWREQLRINATVEGAPDLAILAADITVGMNSSMLYEANLLGRKAVSLTGHDILSGKSRAV